MPDYISLVFSNFIFIVIGPAKLEKLSCEINSHKCAVPEKILPHERSSETESMSMNLHVNCNFLGGTVGAKQ